MAILKTSFWLRHSNLKRPLKSAALKCQILCARENVELHRVMKATQQTFRYLWNGMIDHIHVTDWLRRSF